MYLYSLQIKGDSTKYFCCSGHPKTIFGNLSSLIPSSWPFWALFSYHLQSGIHFPTIYSIVLIVTRRHQIQPSTFSSLIFFCYLFLLPFPEIILPFSLFSPSIFIFLFSFTLFLHFLHFLLAFLPVTPTFSDLFVYFFNFFRTVHVIY
jgi:hypothetical protein